MSVILGLSEHSVEIFNSCKDSDAHLSSLGWSVGTGVESRSEALADLFDLHAKLSN